MIAANGKSGFLGALVAGFRRRLFNNPVIKENLCDKLPDALEKIDTGTYCILLLGILINRNIYDLMSVEPPVELWVLQLIQELTVALEGMAGSS